MPAARIDVQSSCLLDGLLKVLTFWMSEKKSVGTEPDLRCIDKCLVDSGAQIMHVGKVLVAILIDGLATYLT